MSKKNIVIIAVCIICFAVVLGFALLFHKQSPSSPAGDVGSERNSSEVNSTTLNGSSGKPNTNSSVTGSTPATSGDVNIDVGEGDNSTVAGSSSKSNSSSKIGTSSGTKSSSKPNGTSSTSSSTATSSGDGYTSDYKTN